MAPYPLSMSVSHCYLWQYFYHPVTTRAATIRHADAAIFRCAGSIMGALGIKLLFDARTAPAISAALYLFQAGVVFLCFTLSLILT